MTDNEIIKSLECCYDLDSTLICQQCPLHQTEDCRDGYLGMKALDLINRQKAEIGRLLHENHTLGLVQNGYNDMLEICKAEAIKEFAERVKEHFYHYPDDEEASCLYVINTINDLVRDMVGDA